MMYLLFTFIVSVVVGPAVVMAQVPAVAPSGEPTTTFPPTGTPTKAPIPAPVPFRPCYSNLTEIEEMVNFKNPFIVETYTLCPNTIYEIGIPDPVTYQYGNGFNPIFTRSNSIYQCGADGKSSNGCVIRGGEIQIYHDFFSFNQENKVNVVIKGLTFEDAGLGAISLAAPGDISFIDCIFRVRTGPVMLCIIVCNHCSLKIFNLQLPPYSHNHENAGVLPLLYSHQSTRRLAALTTTPGEGSTMGQLAHYYAKLAALRKYKTDARKSYNRRLQGGDTIVVQKVTIEGCLFEGNKIGPDGFLTIDGMILVASADNELTVKNTIFQNNDFAVPINGANGFAINAVEGAKVTITDTCFINNAHVGAGVVVVDGVAELFTSSGNFGSEDPGLECEFARVAGTTCVDFDATECMAVNAFAPLVAVPVEDVGDNTEAGSTSSSISMKFGSICIASLLSFLAM